MRRIEIHNASQEIDIESLITQLQEIPKELPHQERTKSLLDTPQMHIIMSAYYPGEGEELHTHPTTNTLYICAGVFDIWTVDALGVQKYNFCEPGAIISLTQGQPHRVQAREDQSLPAVIMVQIVEGMHTDAPGYSRPVGIGL